jgi:hypothetical protein
MSDKVLCSECGWHGYVGDVDRVKGPGSDDIWLVCRECRMPEHLLRVCDEPGCWDKATCGTPSPDGYRSTCGRHKPR